MTVVPTPVFNYPLDLTGTASTNRVVNEEYLIGAIRGRIFVPRGGPFYGNSTVLYDLENNRELIPRVDYYLLHYYEEASDRSDQPVYAANRIVNPEVSTRIGMTTQYVGGEFSFSYAAIASAVRTLEMDGRPVNWGDLVGTPSEFNPAPHLHDIRNTYNWNSVVDALGRLEYAILNGNTASQSLLIDTIQQKLALMDQFRDSAQDQIDQLRLDMDNEFIAYDGEVQTYFTDFRNNLFNYLKTTVIKGSVYTVSLNKVYTVYPTNVNTATWNATVTIPSTLTPSDGDYIQFNAARDGCTLTLNAVNAPIRRMHTVAGVGQLTTDTTVTVALDRFGVKLVWDSRNGTWNMVQSIDPSTVKFDRYDLVELTTTGACDLSKSNRFLIQAGANRMISLTNIPTGRSTPVRLAVTGNGTVLWPAIEWANGQTPILSANKTIIELDRVGTTWVGTWYPV